MYILFHMLLLGITNGQKEDCNCEPCKLIQNEPYTGLWNLVEPMSSRCNDSSCLYSLESSGKEMCFCDPGPREYDWCHSVSCKCPSAGVEGGYMEYSQVNQKLSDLEATNSALVEEMAALKSKVADNKDALENKCDVNQCTAIKTDVDLVGSCIADKSSNNCPSAAAGKVSITDAITALETPSVFNCLFMNGDVETTLEVLAPYSCDINDDNVVDESTGKFTVAKAGKYRLTFMALNFPLNKKKVSSVLVKTSSGVESKIARSVAQSFIGAEQEQITTTIDIIHKLHVGDTIHVYIQVKNGPKLSGQVDTSKPQQVTFTGEFIRE